MRMTEQIKSAISVIENEKECVQSDCDRDCSKCELVKEEAEIVGAFDTAIRSLQAWSEVLQELEEVKEDIKESNFGYCIGKLNGLNKAIDIIKQKLSEVENEQSK